MIYRVFVEFIYARKNLLKHLFNKSALKIADGDERHVPSVQMEIYRFVVPLACLPHVANKVLLSHHKVNKAGECSRSCKKRFWFHMNASVNDVIMTIMLK